MTEFVATMFARGLIPQPVIERLLKLDHMLKEEQKYVHASVIRISLKLVNLQFFYDMDVLK